MSKEQIQNWYDIAEAALGLSDEDSGEMIAKALRSNDPVHQYWGAQGALIRGSQGYEDYKNLLKSLAVKPTDMPFGKIVASEIIGRYGTSEEWQTISEPLASYANMKKHGIFTAMMAMNALDHVPAARQNDVVEILKKAPTEADGLPGRMRNYVPRLLGDFLGSK